LAYTGEQGAWVIYLMGASLRSFTHPTASQLLLDYPQDVVMGSC